MRKIPDCPECHKPYTWGWDCQADRYWARCSNIACKDHNILRLDVNLDVNKNGS